MNPRFSCEEQSNNSKIGCWDEKETLTATT
jgi:hypothetical protein